MFKNILLAVFLAFSIAGAVTASVTPAAASFSWGFGH
jgi:hypothetical protein